MEWLNDLKPGDSVIMHKHCATSRPTKEKVDRITDNHIVLVGEMRFRRTNGMTVDPDKRIKTNIQPFN